MEVDSNLWNVIGPIAGGLFTLLGVYVKEVLSKKAIAKIKADEESSEKKESTIEELSDENRQLHDELSAVKRRLELLEENNNRQTLFTNFLINQIKRENSDNKDLISIIEDFVNIMNTKKNKNGSV